MPGTSMSALTDYGSDSSTQRQDMTAPQLGRSNPQLFLALAGTEPWVYAWQMSL